MEEHDKKMDLRTTEIDPTTDSSTGLHTPRYFNRQLEIEIKRAERYLHPLSLIVTEIDDPGSLPGREEDSSGGARLGRVGALLKASTRETNLVSRYGSRGFSILLPE